MMKMKKNDVQGQKNREQCEEILFAPSIDIQLAKKNSGNFVLSGRVQAMIFAVAAMLVIVIGVLMYNSITRKTMDVRLTNMFGVTLSEKYVDGRWTLGSEEEVLVWMDLPNDIDQLKGRLESTFPYRVKAGETGKIKIKLLSYENDTVYTGTLKFVATEDLVLESGVSHKSHTNSGEVQFWNDVSCEMNCLEDILGSGKKTYMHYSLYTSSKNAPIIFSGGYSSTGYNMLYDIRAIGRFDYSDYKYAQGSRSNSRLITNWLPTELSPDELAGGSTDL